MNIYYEYHNPEKEQAQKDSLLEQLQRISLAFLILSNPHSKRVYDTSHFDSFQKGILLNNRINSSLRRNSDFIQFYEDVKNHHQDYRLIPLQIPSEIDLSEDKYNQTVLVQDVEIEQKITLKEIFQESIVHIPFERRRLEDLRKFHSIQMESIDFKLDVDLVENPKKVFKGQGNQYTDCTSDLVINFLVEKDPIFTSSGHNLIKKCDLSLKEALTLKDFIVENIDGKKHLVVFDSIITDKTVIKIPGEGFKVPKKLHKFADERADLYLHFNIEFPKFIRCEERETLKRILKA